jgi:hypothetical protein
MQTRTARALTAVLLGGLAATLAAALPQQLSKTAGWRSLLVTNDDKGLADADFVKMVTAFNGGLGGRQFHFLASFTQCFGGGFADELGAQKFPNFGANSASAYFEPSSYDPAAVGNVGSYYSFAWKIMANRAGPPTDQVVTSNASDAIDITKAVVAGIKKNPDSPTERPQYRSDPGAAKPPEPLHAADLNYAILWVGQPDSRNRDFKDLDDLYTVLTNPAGFYKYKPAEIYILWGDGTNPALGNAWKPWDKATTVKLQAAWTDITKQIGIADPGKTKTVQVFFWAGDHGNADAPITMTVSDFSVGLPGTGVAAQQAAGLAGATIYLGGTGTNWALLVEQTAGSTELKALSFGDDFQNPAALFATYNASQAAEIYFSVDNQSVGLPGTDVFDQRPKHLPGADVYARTDGGNRQVFDGTRSLGLNKANPPNDELNDFVLRDITGMLDPKTGLPTRPVFFANELSSKIWVYDPAMPAGQTTYVYYDFPAADFANPPNLVDALAMVVNLNRRNAATKQLYFDPTQDYMLFSVGRNENKAPWNGYLPCQILAFGPPAGLRVWAGCSDLGLANGDNVDGLDIGAGQYGQPITFAQELPWPQYPYPNQPSGSPPPMPPPQYP